MTKPKKQQQSGKKTNTVARQIYIPSTLWDVFRAAALLQQKEVTTEYITEAMTNQLKMDAPKLGLTLKLPG